MSILVRFTPPVLTAEMYDQTVRILAENGDWPTPDGLEYHACFGTSDKLSVSEVWSSQEHFAAHGEKLMPVLAQVGVEPGEPEFIEIYASVRP